MVVRRVLALPLFLLGSLYACGTDDAAPNDDTSGTSNVPGKGATPDSGTPSTNIGSDASAADPFVGIWDVKGSDDRGSYEGQVEVRADGATYKFTRVVRYVGVTVEDGRELHWVIRGKLARSGSDKLTLEAALARLDFISSRGGVTRTAADIPIPLNATLTVKSGDITGTITGLGVSLSDTWSHHRDLPATPIFEDKRTIVPAHDPPSAADKATKFALYSSYQQLDVIKPYVNRPEFKAAIHGHVVDPTDLEFYRQNPNALRVIGKVIDAVSLGETRARADAYRYTLGKKAELYDKDIETRFIDPDVGMIPDGGLPGADYKTVNPSGDGSLWTGVYMAGQVYRFQVTGEAQAKANVLRSLNALLTLQEITGDWTKFARVLRKATGSPQPPWHAGTGTFANLEWMEGGNNDMIKGLFYGYTTAWELLCEGGKTGYESYCERIRTNTKHLADDVQLGGSNAPASQFSNKLPAAWMAAVFADNVSDQLNYRAKAEGYWTAGKSILASTPSDSFQGQVDGSGLHLSSVGDLVQIYLAKRIDLGGDSAAAMRTHIDKSYDNIHRFRLPEWDMLAAATGSSAGNASAIAPMIANGISRLQEAMYPKQSYNVDRTITPEFCMSPYPTHPWKGDWMQYPTNDRTTGINSYPLFEMHPDVMYWKVGNDYRGAEGYETPGGDYSHLYWFARKFGLLSATD
ncbi:MAG: hypothetical protein U0235_10950 [Polyangiaceae bacterium]